MGACNPGEDPLTFRNYEPVLNDSSNPAIKGLTCGTTNIIKGREEELRRKTKNLEEYLSKWPDIGELGPVKSV